MPENKGENPELEYYLSEPVKQDKIVIYQLLTRLFGNKNATNKIYGTIAENGVGKFNDIDQVALQGIAELGITHIWYTGIIEHAVLTDYRAYGISLDDADVVKGRAGSPYAIKDYYDVNPDLAVDVKNRMQEFVDLVNRTHQNGLKVIIDFVPNHVGRQYKSDNLPDGISDLGENDDKTIGFSAKNNFYYLPGERFKVPEGYIPLGNSAFPTKDGQFKEVPAKVTGNNVFKAQPSINDWFETIKVNYGVDYKNNEARHFDPIPPTWYQMKDILRFWAGKGIDGFRCDMAEMVPVEFWAWVIPQIKEEFKDLLFIAEIYNPKAYQEYLFTGKFDYLYDKVQLYDTLRHIIQGQAKPKDITTVWQDLRGINNKMLRFLENHDEQRIASSFFAYNPEKAKPAMTVSALLYSGPVMIFFGQEVGEKAEGVSGFGQDDGRTTHYDYWGVKAHQQWMNDGKFDGGKLSDKQIALRNFYADLLHIAGTHPAINAGEFFDISGYNQSFSEFPTVYSFVRFTDNKTLLIIVNFSEKEVEFFNAILPLAVNGTLLFDSGNLLNSDLLHPDMQIDIVRKNDQYQINMSIAPLESYIFEFSK